MSYQGPPHINDSPDEKLNKLYTDVYFGSGKSDPPLTMRMTMNEDKLDRIGRVLDKLTWVVIGTVVATVGQVVMRALKFL